MDESAVCRSFGDIVSSILRSSMRLLAKIFPEDHDWKLRLQKLDDMIPTLVDRKDFEQRISGSVPEMLPLTGVANANISLKTADDVVRFFDCAVEIILVYIIKNEDMFFYMNTDEDPEIIMSSYCFKGEISETLQKLHLVRNLLLVVRNHQDQDDEAVRSHLAFAQLILAELSFMFCSAFVFRERFQNFSGIVIGFLPEIRAKFDTLMYQISVNVAFQNIRYYPENEVVPVESFDSLCNELRKVRLSGDSIVEKPDMASSSAPMVSVSNKVEKPSCNKLVGVQDAVAQITELLIGGPKSLKIISVVGMPGIGKTTLADHVYEDSTISTHFKIRRWGCATKAYRRETLLFDLLSQFDGKFNPNATGHDLAESLYRKLKGGRYLIVIDNVWDTKVWQDLQGTFPDHGNGSRVLFTTQLLNVAREANSHPYDLRPLSNQESCELLWHKVFNSGTCPPELFATSKEIARHCKGLPLSIVLLAGILRRGERSKRSWEEVSEGVNGDELQFRNILELSYGELPDALRPCFLSFAAFPEDTSTSVSKLIQVWISQGFVGAENCDQRNLEEKAESYLIELIDRSLVMVARRSSRGGVKACRVHDLLRDFCSFKLKSSSQENSMLEETMFSGVIRETMFSGGTFRRRSIRHLSAIRQNETSSERPVFVQESHPTRQVFSERSILSANQQIGLNDSFIVKHQSLRVLDLGNVRTGSSLEASDIILIAKLVNLRFLWIRPRRYIPAEVGNLLYLQTLILTGVFGQLILPDSLWGLSHLRNILMDQDSCFFSLKNCRFSPLHDLKCVSCLSLVHGHGDEYLLPEMLPNLEKLACRFESSWDSAKGFNVFPQLDFLNQLQSLKLFFPYRRKTMECPCEFSLPSNLKKLCLSNSRLPWHAISDIMKQLPNLEVLKLLSNAFLGPEWDSGTGDGGDAILFPKLKFLKLDSLDILIWKAENEPFPYLEQVVVHSCPDLDELPPSFGDISTLELIEMKWCSSSAMDSVQTILKVQREYSNDGLKVRLIGSTPS